MRSNRDTFQSSRWSHSTPEEGPSQGERCGAKLPLTGVHRALLEQAEAAGYGASDNSAIIQVFRKDQP